MSLTKNKKLLVSLLSTMLLMFSLGALAAGNAKNGGVRYLFIQNADSMVIQATDQPNTYKVTLNKVQPYMTYFSDRPVRETGLEQTSKFVAQWQQKNSSFSKDAPNAGVSGVKLHGIGANGQVTTVVLVLSNPQYNANKQTLVYTARLLSDKVVLDLKKPITARNVALFIDDYCPSCGVY